MDRYPLKNACLYTIRRQNVKKYTLKRILTSLFTLLAILLVLFILMQLMPGSPFNDAKLNNDQRLALYA